MYNLDAISEFRGIPIASDSIMDQKMSHEFNSNSDYLEKMRESAIIRTYPQQLISSINKNYINTRNMDFEKKGSSISDIIKEKTIYFVNEISNIEKNLIPESRKPIVVDSIYETLDRERTRLPDVAPELYKNRTDKSETIDKFLERVWYDPWIKSGSLTKLAFRELDPSGNIALNNWLKEPKSTENRKRNVLPDHLHLPTKTEVVSKRVSSLSPESLREAQRLGRQANRHKIER